MKRTLIIILSLVILLTLLASCGKNPATTGAVTTTPPETTPLTATAAPNATTTDPAGTLSPSPTPAAGKDFLYAAAMADFFYNINAVNSYYNNGLTAMSAFYGGSSAIKTSARHNSVMLVGYTPASFEDQIQNIPPEFSDELPPDGSMPAPPGACPAAAEPNGKFVTKDGKVVTPDLLKEKDVNTIPADLINVPQDDPDSLGNLIRSLVPENDMQLADPEYWNTTLWDQLKARQVPADSLMDYQMWTLTADIEQEIVSAFRQSLIDQGVPQMVIDAFDSSDKAGWYAKTQPADGDALAKMDITAKLTGSVTGTVHEERDFSIPNLGSAPVFGVQTGDGTVAMDIPGYGPVECMVDIHLDQFDDEGKAVGGTVTATPVDIQGYKVVFTYKPDGTKEGQIIDSEGNILGYLTMTIDEEKFTNYVSIKEGTTLNLPVPAPTTTVFQ